MAKYTESDFQKDLSELTNLINNYSAPGDEAVKKVDNIVGGDDMNGGKRRRKSKSKRGGEIDGGKRKRRSHKKRGGEGEEMDGGKRRRKSKSKRGGEDMDGGKRRRKSKGKRKSHGGAKRMHKKDVDGKLLRSFRVIEINGKNVENNADWSQRFYHGKAKKNTPLQGAKNAYRWIRKHLGKTGKYVFKLMETTKGGDDYGKEFGPYTAKPVKLAKPIVFKLKNKKTGKKEEIVTEYLYDVQLAKGSDK